ncbi:MAG TPA: YbjQ family protein [Acidobacteriota bacterium]|jgi:uncharacterized protein YbjQ (UPF0145 family)|nr:hypothetical protein [Acidobacteriota bacterium]MBO07376.1 hypothetical protein [Acidobacteriota bacterium]MCS5703643.1 YbjQ family protein [Acidobacteriota bacterium]MEE3150735.1 YbjQ family protein [Acidobacteriota bacterium]HJN48139.1 YbjQ family protein [Acidobacteriota bacterium]|tara:strand:- start:2935 stop:3258 length:324 start_codon:yes stop_codon:yes gene_type:complete
MIITTTPGNIAGYRIVKTHGLVRGNTLRARHIGRDIMAGLRAMVGGELTDYTKMLAEAREQALDRMVEEASQMGANAVIGIDFSTAYVMSNVAEVLVYGTAVTIEAE